MGRKKLTGPPDKRKRPRPSTSSSVSSQQPRLGPFGSGEVPIQDFLAKNTRYCEEKGEVASVSRNDSMPD
jgi:hypothetical protein